MKRYTMRYPGDPASEVLEMTRAEFLAAFPREPMVLEGWDASGAYRRQEYSVGPDEIMCDLCNADPGDTVFVLYGGSRAYCRSCANEGVLPYCTEEPA